MWEYIWWSEVSDRGSSHCGSFSTWNHAGDYVKGNWILVNISLMQFSVIPILYHLRAKNKGMHILYHLKSERLDRKESVLMNGFCSRRGMWKVEWGISQQKEYHRVEKIVAKVRGKCMCEVQHQWQHHAMGQGFSMTDVGKQKVEPKTFKLLFQSDWNAAA